MKPIVMYVDDEPRNLTVFEASMPDEWEVICCDSAVEALKTVKSVAPWVVISDQRMPTMTGLEFLEISAQLIPDTIRIIATGQTEEQTIIQLVRRAKIFDYITKPWDTDDLRATVSKAIDYYVAVTERRRMLDELNKKNEELARVNGELHRLTIELDAARIREAEQRREVEAWAPAPVVAAIRSGNLDLPTRRDIIGVTFDIVGSSKVNDLTIDGLAVRSHIIRLFIEQLLKKGGLKESESGDSVYGHFEAFASSSNFVVSALNAAQEFRAALRGFSRLTGITVEAGIAIHLIPQALVQMQEICADSPAGPIIQKSLVTQSPHIDILHRMERIAHDLPGSNIVMSKAYMEKLPDRPPRIVEIGPVVLRGQKESIEICIIPSDLASDEDLKRVASSLIAREDIKQAS